MQSPPRTLAAHHVAAGGTGGRPISWGELGAEYRFPAGSITKTVVALAAARLATSGRLDWDVPVAGTTLRDLLLHRSGLPFELSPVHWGDAILTAAQLAEAVEGAPRLAVPPGTWHYSNLGYAIAADVVARAAGLDVIDLMHEWVLDPLGMRDTSYPDPEREGPTALGAGAAAGALWSTHADLARLGAALDGAYPDLVGAREIEVLLQGGTPLPDGTVWGAGIRTFPVGPHRILFASGTMSDRTAALVVWPRRGVSVLVAERGVAHDSLRDAGIEHWRRPGEQRRTRWWDGQEVTEVRGASSVELLLAETAWPYPLFAGRADSGVLRGTDEFGRPRDLVVRGDDIVGPGIRLTIAVGDSAFEQDP